MLNPDFKEFVRLLNAEGVRFLIVGGYAVALHGHPRYTKDLDVWVAAEPENAKRVLTALDEFGFGSLGLDASDFTKPDHIVQLGYPPSRIDLLTEIPGVSFDSCYEARIEEEIDGVTVPFIDIESLKRSKRASGRPQDIADLEHLE